MSKSKNENIDVLCMPAYEPLTVREECEKYGINFETPHFKVSLFGVWNKLGFVVVIPVFYLQSEYDKSEKLITAVNKYEKALTYYMENIDSLNPFKEFKSFFGLCHFENKLRRTEKSEKIKRYSRSEMHNYIDAYESKKMVEVNKAKLQEKNEMNI